MSLVPPENEIALRLVFSIGKADIRQLSYPYARSERRSYSMEGSQDACWLGYVRIHWPSDPSE